MSSRIMEIRDRVVELRKVPASQLQPHPRNWRLHPEHQRAAMREALNSIGFAGAILAVERDGGLLTCDGHLRSEEMGEQEVPVLILDLDDDEVLALLTSFDPISSLAQSNTRELDALVKDVSEKNRVLIESLLPAMLELKQKASAMAAAEDTAIPPEDFPAVDENIETEHVCPRCSYRWSGGVPS